MSPPAREYLAKCAKSAVSAVARDRAWTVITELQLAGMVRLEWTATKCARIHPTEKGRAALVAP